MKTVLQMLVNILVVCYMLPAVSRFLIKYQMCHVVIHSVIKKLHHRSFVVLQAILFVVIYQLSTIVKLYIKLKCSEFMQ